jgi:ribosomal protein S18 acetylase RimI-like enzyme
MDGTSTIRAARLAERDVETTAELFARAFDGDPMARLITPDDDERHRSLLDGGRREVARLAAYRHVFGAYEGDELCGVAMWVPPGVKVRSSGTAPPPGAVPRILATAVRIAPRLVRYLRARRRGLAAGHATGGWHLAFLATHPDHQRRGVARLLLEHVLDRADADGVPTWLETSDPVNPPIYRRFGFEVVATAEGTDPLPTFWFMVRPPR